MSTRFSRASILMEDAALTVTTPEGTGVTVTTPDADPDSLDFPDSTTPIADPMTTPDLGVDDPELVAVMRQLDEDLCDGTTTVVVTQPGGSIPDADTMAPAVTIDTDDDAADAIADQTADAINDSADEVAEQFEQAEQRVLVAQDIAQYGLSASALAVGRTLGLLTGATFAGMSEEALSAEPILAGSRACEMSQESLISGAGRSVMEFGERALSHTNGVVRRMLGMVTKEDVKVLNMLRSSKFVGPQVPQGVKKGFDAMSRRLINGDRTVADVARRAGGSMKDIIAGAGKTVAAHPTRNAAIAVAVLGALGGAAKLIQITFKGAPAPGTALADMNGWFGKVRQSISAIKWPFGKLTVKDTADHVAKPTIRDRVGRLFCKDRPVTSAEDAVRSASSYTAAAKEWTKESLKAFEGGFKRAMEALKQSLTSGGEGFVRTISSGFKGAAGEGASKSALVLSRGAYVAAIFSVFALVATTVFFVVAGGCRLIRRQLAD